MGRLASSLLLLFMLFTSSLFGAALKDRLKNAHSGEFAVYNFEGQMSLLLLREKDPRFVTFEEITFPQDLWEKDGFSLRDWLSEGAPGATAWTLYEIDLQTGMLTECYSPLSQCWLDFGKEELLLPRLLSLELQRVPSDRRRKIGPATGEGHDHRPLWNPPIEIEGKSDVAKSSVDVWEGRWVEEDTILSQAHFEIYLHASLTFPHWIEVSNGMAKRAVRAVLNGQSLSSPFAAPLPRRPLFFEGTPELTEEGLTLRVQGMKRPCKLQLHLVEVSSRYASPTSLPFEQQEKDGELILTVPMSALDQLMKDGVFYRFLLKSPELPTLFAESDPPIQWQVIDMSAQGQ